MLRSWQWQEQIGNHRNVCNLHPNYDKENRLKQWLHNLSFEPMVWGRALISTIWNEPEYSVLFSRGKYPTQTWKGGNKQTTALLIKSGDYNTRGI